MTEKQPLKPHKTKTKVVQIAALAHYREVRAKLDSGLLDRVRHILEIKQETQLPADGYDRKKTYETILRFMALSKGSKAFMKQISRSLGGFRGD